MRKDIRTNFQNCPADDSGASWDRVIHPPIDDGNNGVVRIALQMEELP